MSEPGTPQAPRRAALAFIFVTVVLDMLALGMIVPVLPHLIEDFLGGDTPRAAQVVGVFGTVWARDAVLLDAGHGRAVGSLRPPTRDPAVQPRTRPRLRADGARADLAWLFVGRLISGVTAASVSTGDGLRGRRDAARAPGAEFRLASASRSASASCSARRSAACSGRSIRACRSGRPPALSLLNAAYGFFVLPESLPPRKTSRVRVAARQPAGLAAIPARAPRSVRARRRRVPEQPGACGAARRLRALCRLSLRLGRKGGRARAGGGRDLLGAGAGGAGGAAGAPLRRTSRHDRGLLAGTAGFMLYAFAPTGALFVAAMPIVGAVGSRGTAVAGHHDAARRRVRRRVNCRERWAVSPALPR